MVPDGPGFRSGRRPSPSPARLRARCATVALHHAERATLSPELSSCVLPNRLHNNKLMLVNPPQCPEVPTAALDHRLAEWISMAGDRMSVARVP